MDTIGSTPAVANPPNAGSLRGKSSSLRSVAGLGKVPLRVGATPVPHAEILDHVRQSLSQQGTDLQIEISKHSTNSTNFLQQAVLTPTSFNTCLFSTISIDEPARS